MEDWGIYIRASGIVALAHALIPRPTLGWESSGITVARKALLEHEFFHCLTETAFSRLEVTARAGGIVVSMGSLGAPSKMDYAAYFQRQRRGKA